MDQETFSSVISSKEDPALSHIYPRHIHTHTHTHTHTHASTHPRRHFNSLKNTLTHPHTHLAEKKPMLMLSDNISDLVFHVF